MKAFVKVLKELIMDTATQKSALSFVPGEVYKIVRQNKAKHLIRLRRVNPLPNPALPDFDMSSECFEQMLAQEAVDITTKI